MNEWLEILIGFVLLLGAADVLVRGAVWWALVLGISPMVVGLTLVAFGTSAPELFVCITSASRGNSGLATGSVLGSNIANIGLIVGITALLKPINRPQAGAKFELSFLLMTSLALAIPALSNLTLGRTAGALLVLSILLFTWMLYRREAKARRGEKALSPDEPKPERPSPALAILNTLFVVGGLAGLKFGGDLLVDGAVGIARSYELSDVLIGVTILAVGTSLPELATSIVAARKGHPEIALGNVLGSNVFNVSLVLGATASIQPIPLRYTDEALPASVGFLMSLLLAIFLQLRGGVSRTGGAVLLLAYLAYIGHSIANA